MVIPLFITVPEPIIALFIFTLLPILTSSVIILFLITQLLPITVLLPITEVFILQLELILEFSPTTNSHKLLFTYKSSIDVLSPIQMFSLMTL